MSKPPPHDAPITITRTFQCSRERLFAALTEPDDLNVWAWGGMGTEPSASVDLKVGGQYAIAITGVPMDDWPSTRWAMRGMYIDIDAPGRLAYTLHWDAHVFYNVGTTAVIDEVVFITLESKDDGSTSMHYVHRGVPSEEAASAHAAALTQTFDVLKTLVEKP